MTDPNHRNSVFGMSTQDKIELSRKIIANSLDGTGCEAAIEYLQEHADEHWTFINGTWHRSYFAKQPVTCVPQPGDLAGIGS